MIGAAANTPMEIVKEAHRKYYEAGGYSGDHYSWTVQAPRDNSPGLLAPLQTASKPVCGWRFAKGLGVALARGRPFSGVLLLALDFRSRENRNGQWAPADPAKYADFPEGLR